MSVILGLLHCFVYFATTNNLVGASFRKLNVTYPLFVNWSEHISEYNRFLNRRRLLVKYLPEKVSLNDNEFEEFLKNVV